MGNQSPNHSVNSGVQNGVNSAQAQKVQNKAQAQKVENSVVNTNQQQKGNDIQIVNSVPSSCNVPKLELRKEIQETLSEPNNPTKPSPKSQPSKALVSNQVFRKTSHLGDQIESANQIRITLMWHPSSIIKMFGTLHLLIILTLKQFEL